MGGVYRMWLLPSHADEGIESRKITYIIDSGFYTGGGRVALSLKDEETDRLARQVAALTGETLTEAVRTALAQRLLRERLQRGQTAGGLAAQLSKLGAECAALPDLDTRTPDELAGYDENGMWS